MPTTNRLGWPLAATATLLGACTSAPDREAEAERLERTVASMPGVRDAVATYSNDFTAGTSMNLSVTLGGASPEQVRAAAERIAESYADDFDEFEPSASFRADGGVVEYRAGDNLPDLDPDVVSADVATIGALTRSGRGPEIVRTAGEPLELTWNVPPEPDAMAAVRDALGSEPAQVSFAAGGRAPYWTVEFPFDAADERRVRTTLSKMSIPVETVGVDDDRIASLLVEPDPARADAELRTVIDRVAPTSSHPLALSWDEDSDVERRFQGSVQVATCDYDEDTFGEREPERFLTPEALKLQKRLRAAYDTC